MSPSEKRRHSVQAMIEMKLAIEAGLAFLAVFAMVPVVIAVCNRWKIYDQPGPLKIHAKPVPRLGGVAITAGMLLAIWFATGGTGVDVVAVIVCIIAVAGIGIVDDVRAFRRTRGSGYNWRWEFFSVWRDLGLRSPTFQR